MNYRFKNDEKIMNESEYVLEDAGTLPLLHFDMLDDLGIVKHCFTTRLGGVSKSHLSSLNLSFSRGDDPENVRENYRRLSDAMNISDQNFVFTDQTHTTNVIRVDRSHAGVGLHKSLPYKNVDGLITNEKKLVLSTFFADCVPLYFVDPVNKCIGLSHSGWRGSVGRMGEKTLRKMSEEFGTNPANVYAAIGPSICQDCYEISEDVALEFIKEFPDHKDEILVKKLKPVVNNSSPSGIGATDNSSQNGRADKNEFEIKYQLNLWKCNEIVLIEAGIKKDHIAVTNICTCCNSDLLFSHRATNGKRGNLGAFMYLK